MHVLFPLSSDGCPCLPFTLTKEFVRKIIQKYQYAFLEIWHDRSALSQGTIDWIRWCDADLRFPP